MASSRWGANMWKMPASCQLDQTGSSPSASRLSWCSTPEISHSIIWIWLGIECLCLCSLWSLLCVLWSSCSLWSLTTFTLCNTADEFDIVTELVVPQLCYKQLLWIQSQKCTIARVLRALGTSLSSPSYVVFLKIHSDLFWPNLRCVAQGIGFCANRWQLNVNTYNVWSGDMCTISLLQKWRLSAWLQSVSSAATCQLSCDMSTQLSAQMLLVSSAALC